MMERVVCDGFDCCPQRGPVCALSHIQRTVSVDILPAVGLVECLRTWILSRHPNFEARQ
jgi:hypothetical protein